MPLLPIITKDHWYFVVTCPACEQKYAIGPAPSPEIDPMPKPWPDDIHCVCGERTMFQSKSIERLQAKVSATSVPNAAFRPSPST